MVHQQQRQQHLKQLQRLHQKQQHQQAHRVQLRLMHLCRARFLRLTQQQAQL